eukprot:gene14341-11173_t
MGDAVRGAAGLPAASAIHKEQNVREARCAATAAVAGITALTVSIALSSVQGGVLDSRPGAGSTQQAAGAAGRTIGHVLLESTQGACEDPHRDASLSDADSTQQAGGAAAHGSLGSGRLESTQGASGIPHGTARVGIPRSVADSTQPTPGLAGVIPHPASQGDDPYGDSAYVASDVSPEQCYDHPFGWARPANPEVTLAVTPYVPGGGGAVTRCTADGHGGMMTSFIESYPRGEEVCLFCDCNDATMQIPESVDLAFRRGVVLGWGAQGTARDGDVLERVLVRVAVKGEGVRHRDIWMHPYSVWPTSYVPHNKDQCSGPMTCKIETLMELLRARSAASAAAQCPEAAAAEAPNAGEGGGARLTPEPSPPQPATGRRSGASVSSSGGAEELQFDDEQQPVAPPPPPPPPPPPAPAARRPAARRPPPHSKRGPICNPAPPAGALPPPAPPRQRSSWVERG